MMHALATSINENISKQTRELQVMPLGFNRNSAHDLTIKCSQIFNEQFQLDFHLKNYTSVFTHNQLIKNVVQ